jgi:hypothetical protein
MAAFTGYFDASGTQEEGAVLVAAGAFANVDHWGTFDEQWRDLMAKEGVTNFRMHDLAHFKKSFATGWRENETRRRQFLQAFMTLANQTVEASFVTTLVLSDYHAVNEKYQITEFFGGAYSLAQANCVTRVVGWVLENKAPADEVYFFVEHGDVGQDAFRKLMRENLGYIADYVILLPKRNESGEDITPYHVADVVAYEHHSEHTFVALTGTEKGKPRGLLTNIRETLKPDVGILERDVLERMCVVAKVPLRTRAS